MKERIALLAEACRAAVWGILDGEVELAGEDAGQVAAEVESLVSGRLGALLGEIGTLSEARRAEATLIGRLFEAVQDECQEIILNGLLLAAGYVWECSACGNLESTDLAECCCGRQRPV